MPDATAPLRTCVLGATSAMAEATARRLAARGDRLVLVARNGARLEAICADLATRGAAGVTPIVADLATLDDPDALLARAEAELGGLDAVLIFHGVLGQGPGESFDLEGTRRILQVNFNSAAELSLAAAPRLAASPAGDPVLVAVGSVAGDRGRASNFVYGAAKGGLAVLYQGLAHAFARRGSRVRAVVIKAGFVDTPMTAGIPRGGPLWATPDEIARIILRAMERGGPIVYAPWFWRWIMLIFRLLPQPLMNKVNL